MEQNVVMLFLGIATFIGAILLILLQVKLSGRDRARWGLLPMGLLAGLLITLTAVMVISYGSWESKELTVDMDDGTYARMYVRENDAGDIIAFSELKIFNREGKQLDQEEIYIVDLTDPEMRRPDYADIFEEMTEGKKLLARSASEEAMVTDRSLIMFNQAGMYISFRITGIAGSIFILCLPLLVIHIIKRRRVNAVRRAEEMRRMEIQSL